MMENVLPADQHETYVDLRFPSVIRLATTFQDLASEAREIHTDEFIPTNVGNLDDALSIRKIY
ncbi:MAG: hypothetical protein Ct9H300mP22_7050 [Gammaproteobacteria bacterium]|nr:MAG: hypothetical protein Ct9H300mP22_7050 [Gammaproteobacteria bacterium]